MPAKAELEKLQQVSEQLTHIDAIMTAIQSKTNRKDNNAKKNSKEDTTYTC